jgi:hypothetical protein
LLALTRGESRTGSAEGRPTGQPVGLTRCIRQVAEKFDYSYSAMRRILRKHVVMRNRGAAYANIYSEDRA